MGSSVPDLELVKVIPKQDTRILTEKEMTIKAKSTLSSELDGVPDTLGSRVVSLKGRWGYRSLP